MLGIMLSLRSPEARSNRRKMRRYSGFCKATERPKLVLDR